MRCSAYGNKPPHISRKERLGHCSFSAEALAVGRLHTVLERTLEEVSFHAPSRVRTYPEKRMPRRRRRNSLGASSGPAGLEFWEPWPLQLDSSSLLSHMRPVNLLAMLEA